MSAEYQAALDNHNVAIRKFTAAQSAYRSRQIDDDAFLSARAEYDAATAEYDAAYAVESDRDDDDCLIIPAQPNAKPLSLCGIV